MAQYFPLMVFFVIMLGLVSVVLVLNIVLGPKPHNSQVKLDPFECGSEPLMSNQNRMPIKFYLIAIQFILFDIEVVMLYPWATVARELGFAAYLKALIFIAVLALGLVYCWRKGALEWK